MFETSRKYAPDIRTRAQKIIDAARETNRILGRITFLVNGKSLTVTAGEIIASATSVAATLQVKHQILCL